MELKTVFSCPLGHKCQEVKYGEIHQCTWFVKLAGTNPNTGDSVDEHGCAMSWLPVLLIENARTNRGTSAAVESFRNDMVEATNSSQQLLLATAQLGANLKLIGGNQ